MTAIGRAAHTTKWLAIGELSVVWAQSQRGLNETHAAKIAANFDPDMFGVISVAQSSNGAYHIIDGQHRVEALRQLWGDEKQKVPCNVFDAATPERAAAMFDSMNTSRKPPRAVETFLVRVTAESEPEAAVHKIITGLGYRVSNHGGDGTLSAVVACVSIFNRYGSDALLNTLLVIRATWGMVRESVDASLLRGYAMFLAKYGKDVDRDRLVACVAKKYSPGRILGEATSLREMFHSSTAECVGTVLRNAYNNKLRSGRLGE